MFSDGTGLGSEICCRQIFFRDLSRCQTLCLNVPRAALSASHLGHNPRAHLSALSPSSNRCLAYERISLSFLCQLYSLPRSPFFPTADL
ncbi:hypothetical protein GQ55_3G286500 [Panicum hallii var. hallii]|uniref:Uncharacterized protein n=1 Tax=Panicum hallii var. hallii TaxID=1504633 RepID=A0A2T7EEE0_9POAL|nr:hypothetical protein GQ55_3G286500 [Panicum hallii var. hallii]